MPIWGGRNGETIMEVSNKKTEEIFTWRIIGFKDWIAVDTYSLRERHIGSFLVDFLATDFTKFESFFDLIKEYGLSFLVEHSKTAKDIYATAKNNAQIDPITKKRTIDYKTRIKYDYDKVILKLYEEVVSDFIEIQDIIKEAIFQCIDANGPEWSKGLTVTQRYFVMTNCKINLTSKVKGYSKFISPDFSVDSNKLNERHFPENYLSCKEYANMIAKSDLIFIEQYNTGSPGGICFVSFKKLLEYNMIIKKCQHCDKYFMPTKRIDEEYCDRIAKTLSNGLQKTCKEIGPMVKYSKKENKDPVVEEYRKSYKAKHAKIKSKKISKEEFYAWNEEAKAKVKEVRSGTMSLDEFKTWIMK